MYRRLGITLKNNRFRGFNNNRTYNSRNIRYDTFGNNLFMRNSLTRKLTNNVNNNYYRRQPYRPVYNQQTNFNPVLRSSAHTRKIYVNNNNNNNVLRRIRYIEPPRQIIPRSNFIRKEINREKSVSNVMLFANMRDETNINEWCAHHLLMGFDLIYIFDHKSVTPIKNILSPELKDKVIVERCELENSYFTRSQNKTHIKNMKTYFMTRSIGIARTFRADWFIHIDADEYFVLNNYDNVKSFLNEYKNADSVAVNWLFFGTNGHIETPQGLVIENYTKSTNLLDQHIKTFVRPEKVTHTSNPHFYFITDPNRSVTTDHTIMHRGSPFYKINKTYYAVDAYIAHYIYQSEEMYKKRKVNRNSDDNTGKKIFDDDIHKQYNEITNNYLKNKYSERVRELLRM